LVSDNISFSLNCGSTVTDVTTVTTGTPIVATTWYLVTIVSKQGATAADRNETIYIDARTKFGGADQTIPDSASWADVIKDYHFFIGCSNTKNTFASFNGHIWQVELYSGTALTDV
jgi:hypothetical protein